MRHPKKHIVLTTALCICMGILSCTAFGEDPEWEDAVPVEDTGYEAEDFIKYLIVAVHDKTGLAVSKTIHVATKGGIRVNFTGL